jgi:branched-chain amino acid transport system ATP-binding protein
MRSSQNLALDVTALSAGYGRFDVVHDIALKVAKGEAVALLGPNGAGKTTVLKAIMGLVNQRRGSIRVVGEDVSAFPAHRVARGFAAIAPEGRRLFLDQTVEDNLLLGGLHLRRDRGRLQALLKSVYDLFPILYEYRRRLSSYLSGGEQQMVAIGRMLMSDPKVMLLDEPSVALSPVAVGLMVDALLKLRQRGASLLLVEQRIDVAVRVCDRLYVIAHGAIVDEMSPTTSAMRGFRSSTNIWAERSPRASKRRCHPCAFTPAPCRDGVLRPLFRRTPDRRQTRARPQDPATLSIFPLRTRSRPEFPPGEGQRLLCPVD